MRKLKNAEMVRLVEQAMVLLGEYYVHLPQKRVRYAFDPLGALRHLRDRLGTNGGSTLSTEEFHEEMFAIFRRLRDNHTRYSVRGRQWASLGVRIERCFEDGQAIYLVTRIDDAVAQAAAAQGRPDFELGVRVTRWSGLPIEAAIERNAEQFWGANRDAFLAQGLYYLTKRPLGKTIHPLEDWVELEYVSLAGGDTHSIRLEWKDTSALVHTSLFRGESFAARVRQGLDTDQDEAQELDAALSRNQSSAASQSIEDSAGFLHGRQHSPSQRLTYATFEHRGEEFGYIRVWKLLLADAKDGVKDFYDQFKTALEAVRNGQNGRTKGLVIDMRGNPGGDLIVPYLMLQCLSSSRIVPTRYQFRHTHRVQRLVRRNPSLAAWQRSLDLATTTGSVFSQALVLETRDDLAPPKPYYDPPVTLIVDAMTYSAAEVFAAAFQDYAIGQVIGTDRSTGAGGANAWTHDVLRSFANRLFEIPLNGGAANKLPEGAIRQAFAANGHPIDGCRIAGPAELGGGAVGWRVKMGRETRYTIRYLPRVSGRHVVVSGEGPNALVASLRDVGVDMTCAVRRALRTGPNVGLPIENLGVEPELYYELQRDDIQFKNEGLLKFAADHLLSVAALNSVLLAPAAGGAFSLTATASEVDKLVVETKAGISQPVSHRIARGQTGSVDVPIDTTSIQVSASVDGRNVGTKRYSLVPNVLGRTQRVV